MLCHVTRRYGDLCYSVDSEQLPGSKISIIGTICYNQHDIRGAKVDLRERSVSPIQQKSIVRCRSLFKASGQAWNGGASAVAKATPLQLVRGCTTRGPLRCLANAVFYICFSSSLVLSTVSYFLISLLFNIQSLPIRLLNCTFGTQSPPTNHRQHG
jgi:hypothetical protein